MQRLCCKPLWGVLFLVAFWFYSSATGASHAATRGACVFTIDPPRADSQLGSPVFGSEGLEGFPGLANQPSTPQIQSHAGGWGSAASGSGAGHSRDVSELTSQTIAWLKAHSPTAARVIATLESSQTQYRIMTHADSDTVGQAADLMTDFAGVGDYFWSARNEIHWDPKTGITWTNTSLVRMQTFPGDSRFGYRVEHRPGHKGSISPAITLMHELGHAYHKQIDPARFAKETKTHVGGRWDTAEERRVMREIEWPVVKELRKSTGTTDLPRPSHNGVGTYGYEPYDYSVNVAE